MWCKSKCMFEDAICAFLKCQVFIYNFVHYTQLTVYTCISCVYTLLFPSLSLGSHYAECFFSCFVFTANDCYFVILMAIISTWGGGVSVWFLCRSVWGFSYLLLCPCFKNRYLNPFWFLYSYSPLSLHLMC